MYDSFDSFYKSQLMINIDKYNCPGSSEIIRDEEEIDLEVYIYLYLCIRLIYFTEVNP
jgi:hypothetical protein